MFEPVNIILIGPDEFKQALSISLLTDSLDSLDKSNIEKTNNIINSYSCFKEEFSQAPQYHVKQFFKSHSGHGVKNSASHQQPSFKNNSSSSYPSFRKPIKDLSYIDKVKRETLSLLNKLSLNNFTVVSDKLMKYCDTNNVITVIDMIFIKCYSQDSYVHLFMQLFFAIKCKFGDVVYASSTKFVNDTTSGLEYNLDELFALHAKQEEYDTFCEFVLKKSHVIFKFKCVVLLITNNLTIDCLDVIVTDILIVLQKNRGCKVRCDVLMYILKEIFMLKTKKEWTIEVETLYPTCTLTSKTSFLVEDMLNRIRS
jgi:hypothetical protein